MTISSIGFGGGAYSITGTAHKPSAAQPASSGSKGVVATISEAAKELAAKQSGTTSQEEAAESAAAQIQEQAAGLS